MNKKITIDLIAIYFAKVAIFLVTIGQISLINKHFGVEVYGQLVMVISAVGFCASFITARSSEAVTRFYTRERMRKDDNLAKFVLILGSLVDLLTALLLFLIVLFFSEYISGFLFNGVGFSAVICTYSIAVFFSFLKSTVLGFYQARKMFVTLVGLNCIEPILLLIFVIALIGFNYPRELDSLVCVYVASAVLGYIVSLCFFLSHFLKEYGWPSVRIDRSLMREYFRFSIKTFASSTLKAGHKNVDNLILGYFCNPMSVGIYQLLKKILSPIFMVSGPFSTLYYPTLVEQFEKNDHQKIVKIIKTVSVLTFGIAVVYSIVAYILLPFILKYNSIENVAEVKIFFIFVALQIAVSSQMWWMRIFSNTVNPNLSVVANLIATLLQLSMTIYLTYKFHFIGLLLGVLFMKIVVYIFWVYHFRSFQVSEVQVEA